MILRRFWLALLTLAMAFPVMAQDDPDQEGRVARRLPGGVQPGILAEDASTLEQEESRIAQEVPKTDVFAQFGSFFAEAFSFIRFTREPGGAASTIEVKPKEVNLEDTREVRVTFRVANKTGKMLRLTFPTEQRLEILVRNEAGSVIERWSEDRSFGQAMGFVTINPDEKLEYVEDLSTREMKAGEAYFIEASLVDHPEYAAIEMIKPISRKISVEGEADDLVIDVDFSDSEE